MLKASIIIASFILLSLGLFLAYKWYNILRADNFDNMIAHLVPGKTTYIKVSEIDPDNFIFMDVRSKKEFDISHIKGAIHNDYDAFDEDLLKSIPKDSKIITYCSVGYRSDIIGQKLKKIGFKNIYNLYGGIFEWVNSGKKVVDIHNHPTKKIHGYGENWAKWIKKGEIVY